MKNQFSKNLIILSIITVFLFSVGITVSNLARGLESEEYSFVSKMGSKGTGDGQFLELEDIELNSFNDVCVSDRGTASIQIFTKVR